MIMLFTVYTSLITNHLQLAHLYSSVTDILVSDTLIFKWFASLKLRGEAALDSSWDVDRSGSIKLLIFTIKEQHYADQTSKKYLLLRQHIAQRVGTSLFIELMPFGLFVQVVFHHHILSMNRCGHFHCPIRKSKSAKIHKIFWKSIFSFTQHLRNSQTNKQHHHHQIASLCWIQKEVWIPNSCKKFGFVFSRLRFCKDSSHFKIKEIGFLGEWVVAFS